MRCKLQASDLSKINSIDSRSDLLWIINLYHNKAKSVYLEEFYGNIRY